MVWKKSVIIIQNKSEKLDQNVLTLETSLKKKRDTTEKDNVVVLDIKVDVKLIAQSVAKIRLAIQLCKPETESKYWVETFVPYFDQIEEVLNKLSNQVFNVCEQLPITIGVPMKIIIPQTSQNIQILLTDLELLLNRLFITMPAVEKKN